MRVTLVSAEWPNEGHVGGVGRYAYRLAGQLADLVELTVVTAAGAVPLDGVCIVEVPKARGRFDRYYGLPYRLAAAVRRLSSDVVHSFGDDYFVRADGARVVRTFLGSSWEEAKSSKGLRRLNHVLLAVLELISAARADVKIAIAPETFERFHCDALMPPVVRVDPCRRNPTDVPSVAFIGSFEGRKRGWLALATIERAAELLGTDIRLRVVGPEEDRSKWPDWVEHHAGLDDEQVAHVLASSWLLLAPSSYEGFGIPVYEALCQSVPVVASHNAGSTYIAALVPKSLDAQSPGGIVAVVADDALADAVVTRLARGPLLVTDEETSSRAVADMISSMASPASLVEDIYVRSLGQ